MPYRRLPNTDQARLRALKSASEIAEKSTPAELKYSQHLMLELNSFLPQFEQALNQYNNSRALQSSIGAQMAEAAHMARLYLSHFIQVFNMCIARGEIKADMRLLLGLEECGNTLPDLSSDKLLLDWGKKIIEGEEQRISQNSGNRIYNPSIAVVKVKLSLFEEAYNKHRDILQTIQKHHAKLDSMREKTDSLITNVWNEVERALAPIDSEEKRNMCMEYGIVYFLRPKERQQQLMGM